MGKGDILANIKEGQPDVLSNQNCTVLEWVGQNVNMVLWEKNELAKQQMKNI
jgi:hypothetical protein